MNYSDEAQGKKELFYREMLYLVDGEHCPPYSNKPFTMKMATASFMQEHGDFPYWEWRSLDPIPISEGTWEILEDQKLLYIQNRKRGRSTACHRVTTDP